MNENIPQTAEEIADALMAARNQSLAHHNYADSFSAQAREVLRWREAWLRDAEPRLRPVTESPRVWHIVIACGIWWGVLAVAAWAIWKVI